MNVFAKSLLLVVCVSIALVSCEEDGDDTSFRGVIPVAPNNGPGPEPEPEKADEIFPLAVGNRWVQETSDRFGNVDTIWSEITDTTRMMVDGVSRKVYVLAQSSGSDDQYMYCDSTGFYQAYEGVGYLTLKFPVEAGEEFSYDQPLGSQGTMACIDTNHELTMYNGEVVSTYVYVLGDITGGQLRMHYAPNIGPIRIEHLFAGQYLAEQKLIHVELY